MATSIKTKFRPSTVAGKAGTVYYQLIHNRRVARINTDIHVQPNEWKALRDSKSTFKGMLLFIRQRIENDTHRVMEIVNECEGKDTDYSVKTIIALYKTPNNEGLPKDKNIADVPSTSKQSFFTFMRNRIKELKDEKRNGTAANYRSTLNSFTLFANGTDLTLSMMTADLMERYESWLKVRGLKRNSTSFYMRILRAVYNRAVRQGLVCRTCPFSKVYTGTDKTRKRAVSEETITALNNLDLKGKPNLQLARDLFMFSFATCGMPFVDMAYLKKSNVKDGYITYERRKTGQPIQIRILPFIENIMKKYEKENSPYVFPVISSTDPDKAYCEYRNALVIYNHKLHRLSSMISNSSILTSYVSRHSWATIAREHGNPVSAIGKALGHTNESTTQVYLASLGETVVDKMNEEILKCLQR